jgi:hypothetical protein
MGSGPQAVPAELKRDGSSYEISLDLPNNDSSRTDPVRVHIGFDTFYVPDKLRKNGDTRELVIRAPSQVRMFVE